MQILIGIFNITIKQFPQNFCGWNTTVKYVLFYNLHLSDKLGGDVAKFEFEFDNVFTSNVFNKFEIRRMF